MADTDASHADTREEAGNPFSWRFVTPLLLGSSVNAVNSTLIATALVPIAEAMHVPVGHATVLIAVLYLTSAIAQPTGGKLAEELGPRRVFLAGRPQTPSPKPRAQGTPAPPDAECHFKDAPRFGKPRRAATVP